MKKLWEQLKSVLNGTTFLIIFLALVAAGLGYVRFVKIPEINKLIHEDQALAAQEEAAIKAEQDRQAAEELAEMERLDALESTRIASEAAKIELEQATMSATASKSGVASSAAQSR